MTSQLGGRGIESFAIGCSASGRPPFIFTDDLNLDYLVVGEAGIGWYYRIGPNVWTEPFPTYETAKHVAETELAEFRRVYGYAG